MQEGEVQHLPLGNGINARGGGVEPPPLKQCERERGVLNLPLVAVIRVE